jgi:hypothetical protein
MERLPLLIIVEMTPGPGMSLFLNHFCIGDYFCVIPYITLYAVEVNRFVALRCYILKMSMKPRDTPTRTQSDTEMEATREKISNTGRK